MVSSKNKYRLLLVLILVGCAILFHAQLNASSTVGEAITDNKILAGVAPAAYLPLIIKPEQTPIPTPTPIVPTPTSSAPNFAEQVVALVNQERTAVGCNPLTMHPQLNQAAYGHSQDMAFNDFFSHTGSDGSTPFDRMLAAGYTYSTAGENIAAGYTSPHGVMEGWMNSPGHRSNILNCAYQHIGVGYYYHANDTGDVNYYHYWTQVFGAP